MINSKVNAFQARNIIVAISCSALLLGCLETAPKTPTFGEIYQQWSQKYVEMLNLARAGKCDETIKSFDHLVKTYPDFSTAGQSLIKRSSSSVATCFINAGRANEVVKQFENLCIPGKTTYLDLQRNICTEENLQGAAAAYKLVGRENPFEDPQSIVKQIISNHEAAIANSKIELINIEYTAGLQAAIRAIFARVVTQRPGYSHETRLHYQQSKIAATEAIAFIDAQAPKCKVARNDYCLKTLAEDRQRYADYFVDMSAKLNESLEDQAAARRIAGIAPAILSAIANAGGNYAAANPIRQSPQISTPSISSTLKPIAPPVSTTGSNPYATNRADQPATGGGSVANGSNSLRASSRDSGSATGSVGQNRGKGGNPDYLYDDVNHGNCVSVKVVAGNTGSKLAYGRYNLINRCAYPLKLLACVNVDSADGKPSPTFDNHQDGQKCPGMGWGGTTLKASEIKENKTWFEYRNIKWQIRACREGWDFIGEDGRYPSDILGARFSCRMWRP